MSDLFMIFKAIIDEDKCPIVVCDTKHTIIYMNPSSIEKYHKNLVGSSIFDCHNQSSNQLIEKVVNWFKESPSHNRIFTFRSDEQNKDVYMVALRDENKNLIGYYEKHEYRNADTSPLYDFN